MKKIVIALALMCALLLAMVSCGGQDQEPDETDLQDTTAVTATAGKSNGTTAPAGETETVSETAEAVSIGELTPEETGTTASEGQLEVEDDTDAGWGAIQRP